MDSPQREPTLNILQWNSQSLKPKSVEFECLLLQENAHVAIVSETWMEPESHSHISGYNIFRRDRCDSYGGVAIITHHSIKTQVSSFILNNTGIEVLHVKLLNFPYIQNIVSIYCPSTVRTTLSDWDSLFSAYPQRSIIAGDFNGHHTNWSYKNDHRGMQLFDSSLDNGFFSLNNGRPTRIRLVNGVLQESSPDITFASSDIATNFKWDITNESLGSDHVIIKIVFKISNGCTNQNFVKKRNFKKANWLLYKQTLEQTFLYENIGALDSVQVKYDIFVNGINSAAEKSIPLVKICTDPLSKFKPKPYWNADLSKAVAKRRLALSKFRRNPTPCNLDILEKHSHDAKLSLIRAKSQGWRDFCSSINESTSVSEAWNRMRWMKGHKRSKFYASKQQIEDLLCNLAPDYVIPQMPVIDSNNTSLEIKFTTQELDKCLKKKDTAPGDDQITFSMLHNLPKSAKLYLLEIYNLILETGNIPIQWRDIKIVPIPKNYTGSDIPLKLRPISLISCTCKIFHTLLCKRLEWYVEKEKCLSVNTVGFRRSQSCLDCLTRLACYIQMGFSKNYPTLACFLDIENAYNNVTVDSVIQALNGINVGKKICKYLWEFLSERHLKSTFDGNEANFLVRWTSNGIGQGDPLSPLIFNIVTHQICHNITNVIISQYADDFVLYTSCKNLADSVLEVQSAIGTIIKLLGQLGLELSGNKSQVCLFSRGRRRQQITLNINGSLVSQSEYVKYLGVWMDRSLRWGKHINETCGKTQKFLSILKVLAGTAWGMHPKHLRRLYIALIRSRADYASFLFDNSAKTHTSKLDKVQNQAMRIIGGFIRTTPIHVMECELSIPNLALRRKYLAIKYCLKSQSFDNNLILDLLNSLRSHISNTYWRNKKIPLLVTVYNSTKDEVVSSSYPLEMFRLDTWVSNINVGDSIRDTLDNMKLCKKSYDNNILKNIIMEELHTKYFGWLKLYTDGSKIGNVLGAAFYDPRHKVKGLFKMCNSNICIMTAELVAISKALTYLQNAEIDNNRIVIFVDSRSALQHIVRCASGHRGVSITYAILSQIWYFTCNNIDVILQWVPSHVGLRGNEEVDQLAKTSVVDGIELNITPSYFELLPKYKIECSNNWKEYFNKMSLEKGIWYKTLQCEPPRIPWFANIKLNRKFVIIAHRLRSGHVPLNKFRHLMGKSDSPNCTQCDVMEDVHHLLVECVRTQTAREVLMNTFKINLIDVGFVQTILSEPVSNAAILLYKIVYKVFK